MLGKQVHVCFDCYWLPIGGSEMGRHACGHYEERMKPDEDIGRTVSGNSCRLAVKRREFGQVFVYEARRHQVISRRRQPSSANVGQVERRKYSSLPCAIKHLARRVNTVDCCHSFARQPCSRATSATAKIGTALDPVPRHALKLLKQPEVHVLLDSVLVGFRPPSIAFWRRKSSIFSFIKRRKTRHVLA